MGNGSSSKGVCGQELIDLFRQRARSRMARGAYAVGCAVGCASGGPCTQCCVMSTQHPSPKPGSVCLHPPRRPRTKPPTHHGLGPLSCAPAGPDTGRDALMMVQYSASDDPEHSTTDQVVHMAWMRSATQRQRRAPQRAPRLVPSRHPAYSPPISPPPLPRHTQASYNAPTHTAPRARP